MLPLPTLTRSSRMHLYNQVCLSIHPSVYYACAKIAYLVFFGSGEMVQQCTQDKLTIVGIVADRWGGCPTPISTPHPLRPPPTNNISFPTSWLVLTDQWTEQWTCKQSLCLKVNKWRGVTIPLWTGGQNHPTPTHSNIHKKNLKCLFFPFFNLMSSDRPTDQWTDGPTNRQTKPLTELCVHN